MVEIIPKDNENIDLTLKRFRRAVRRSGILRDVFERKYFIKKSEQRHQAKRSPKRRDR